MSNFEERERGFEAKFAHDEDVEFRANARRNKLLGQWAGGLMGLEGQHMDDYARAVVKSDIELPGDEDVLKKVSQDLKGSGLPTTEAEVRRKMDELLAQSREQIRNGV